MNQSSESFEGEKFTYAQCIRTRILQLQRLQEAYYFTSKNVEKILNDMILVSPIFRSKMLLNTMELLNKALKEEIDRGVLQSFQEAIVHLDTQEELSDLFQELRMKEQAYEKDVSGLVEILQKQLLPSMVIHEKKQPQHTRSKSTRKPVLNIEEHFSISQKLLNDLSPSYKPEQSGFYFQQKYSFVAGINNTDHNLVETTKCTGHGTCCCVCGCSLCLSNNYTLNRRFQPLPAPQTIDELFGVQRPFPSTTLTSTSTCSSTCCKARISVPLRFLKYI